MNYIDIVKPISNGIGNIVNLSVLLGENTNTDGPWLLNFRLFNGAKAISVQ